MPTVTTNYTTVKLAEYCIADNATVAGRRLVAVGNSSTETRAVIHVQIHDNDAVTNELTTHIADTSPNGNLMVAFSGADTILTSQVKSKMVNVDTAAQILRGFSVSGEVVPADTVIEPLTTFTVFDKLPRELKNKIFIQAAKEEGRDIYAIEVPELGSRRLKSIKGTATTNHGSAWGIEIVGTSIPGVLASCKGAYDAVMKVGTYKPLLQMKGGDLAYYINPAIDRIHLGSNLPFFNMLPCGTLGEYLANPSEMALIRKATLPLCFIMNDFYWSILSITPLVKLDDFCLVEYVRHPAQTTPFKLELNFEQYGKPYVRTTEEGKKMVDFHIEARPVYKGRVGMEAMIRAFRKIVPQVERQRLMNIWARLNPVFDLVPTLPKITLCMNYSA
jgi:hypothetical protein